MNYQIARLNSRHREYFLEAVGKKSDGTIKHIWKTRPIGQLTKCCEAAVLRKAFPEELGDQYSVEEMEGKIINNDPIHNNNDSKVSDLNNIIDAEFTEEPKKPNQSEFTAIDIKTKIKDAKTINDINLAADLINSLSDSDQKKELRDLIKERDEGNSKPVINALNGFNYYG